MLRPVDRQDTRFLRDMLRHAYHWRIAEDPDRPLYRYVQNWGRPGDAGVIAFAGVTANLRLAQLLQHLSGNSRIARRVLLAWLAGNLLFGSQLTWIMRPFIGAPGLPVQFVRATAFKGNFYETVFHALLRLLNLN